MRTRTLAAMKLSYRSVSRLWRYWSGPSALRGSFTSWENAPESEADRSPAAPIQQQQFAAQSDHSGAIPETRPRAIRKLLREFGSSSSVKRVAEDHLLTGSAFTEVLKSFEDNVFFREHPDVVRIIDSLLSNEGHVDDLLPYFLEYAREKNPLIGPVLELSLTSNLSRPTNWYPWARALQRRIYYHAGPTNSGKTHAAIQRLKAAGSGVYCAPLRMLAHEIFHRCNQEGIACDLRTGEETQFASGDEGQLAPHLSCTVEMVPNIGVDHSYDVAVIDEIQMIEDASRGGAWTRALIGVPAREVHVCGNGSAVDLVQRLASLMNEQLEVISYDRLVPLEVDESSLDGNYSAVRPGDCVIVFSRRKLFDVRRRIAAATGQRCAAVYGSLPPATRVQQAQLFNDPQSDCQVMVATDAVGMGLNLNIRRIVFHDVKKYDGEDCRPLTSAHAKQIAGRAGRYGLNHSSGLVTTFHRNHLEQLKALMSAPIESIKQAGLYPSPEHIKIFSSHLPHAKLPDILMMFERMAQVDENYFLCDMGEQKSVASKLTFAPLTIMDHFVFSKAPVDSANNIEITAIREFAKMYASGQPVVYEHLVKMLGLRGKPGGVANISQLAMIEDYHKVTDIYLWLSMRFPECFCDAERVRQLQSDLGTAIGDSLAISSAKLGRRHPHLQDINHTEMQRLVTYFWSSKGKRKHNNMQALAKIIRDSRRKKTRYGFVNKRNMKRKF